MRKYCQRDFVKNLTLAQDFMSHTGSPNKLKLEEMYMGIK